MKNECFGPQRIVTVEFNIAKAVTNYYELTEKQSIELVHKMLLGAEPYPYTDPLHPYCGDIVNISCGKTTKCCAIWNEKNVK